MREYSLLALVAAAVTFLLVPPVRAFALRIGAAPEVRDRDVHKVPTPRLGGLAMFGGLAAGLLVATHLPYVGGSFGSGQSGHTATALLAAGGLIVVTGFLDDWLGMDALIKLGGQIAAGGLLVYFGMYLPWLPLPQFMGGPTSLDTTLQAGITILIVVVVINAVNFVDGLDGLAAGIVGIAAMATLAYSVALTQTSSGSRINATAAIAAILIGMCVGFLPHNFNPAKIFMGDTGAMLIGLILATSLITITSSVEPSAVKINRFPVILPLILPIAVMILPLVDLIMAVIRRTSAGLSPFAPDRGHLHHRLLDIGHSHRRSVLIMYAWTFLFAFTIVGLSIGGVPLIVFPLTILLAVAVLVMMALPRWRSRREELRYRKGGAHAARRPVSGPGLEQIAAEEPPAPPAPPAPSGPVVPAAPAGPVVPAAPAGPVVPASRRPPYRPPYQVPYGADSAPAATPTHRADARPTR
ncbi:undecaprenyl/decaprenyl-phosphate alpha-N-acetylglucosaminyl 1-phosphate transferase [Planotetraspora sp. A-T 1434]|uniref:glycosyltransferase family 4 protein n=1 Tax=Planotetraspora sp. A-T 1434 TaxID=2979219 RepID=UPI0021BECBBB|nr:undecaprenyl/decaprenyl-phosphate alpha-N-acetylglucosaminyl 1-phosphate transferase [Planotetraspora sp. A-T 1434]MCT9929073.1 undecaprenyl/decaprenyl-phosphate alpha-N-acetylglucosaminyl 1-phosphate transferase [Planotetraspora sp. A-T 1434]